MSEREAIGGNNPPSQIDFTNETIMTLGDWLKNHPAVLDEDEARDGKLLVDRARLCLQDLEDERKAKVAPFNESVRSINEEYRRPRSLLDRTMAELKDRLNAWLQEEEQKRLKAAEEARQRAAEAERLAREAEAREHEAIDDARHGVVGEQADVVLRAREADTAFAAFEKAEREAARAEKATNFGIGGGFGRVLSTRFKEALVVKNPVAAVGVMGWSSRLLEALLSDARAWKREHGQLPDGIVDEGTRRL